MGAPVQLDKPQQRQESVQAVLEPEALMRPLLSGGATGGSGLFEVTAPTASGSAAALAPLFERAVVARPTPLGPLPGALGTGGLIGSWPPTPNGSRLGAGQPDPPSPQQLMTALALTIIAALSATLPLPGLPLPGPRGPLGSGSSSRSSIATSAGNGAAGSTGVNSSRSDSREAIVPLLLTLGMSTWQALLGQSRRIPTGITLTAPLPPG